MNRELKFRVWNQDTNSYIKKYDQYFRETGLYIVDVWADLNPEAYRRRFLVFQQSIGLKDKNGKDIYEGDLIQYKNNSSYDNFVFVVRWSDDMLGYIFQAESGDILENDWSPQGNRFNNLEIVGNIFEEQVYGLRA